MNARALGLVVLLVILVSACGKTVTTNPNDTTPPTVALDLFDIPVQPGASSQPNPESVDATCCDFKRFVHQGEITLLASGRDSEGVRSVSIWVAGSSISCEHSDGTGSIEQGLSGAPAADNADPTPSPTAGLDQRVVSYALDIPGRGGGCVKRSGSIDVYAKSTNYAGQEATTKMVTLQFPMP